MREKIARIKLIRLSIERLKVDVFVSSSVVNIAADVAVCFVQFSFKQLVSNVNIQPEHQQINNIEFKEREKKIAYTVKSKIKLY